MKALIGVVVLAAAVQNCDGNFIAVNEVVDEARLGTSGINVLCDKERGNLIYRDLYYKGIAVVPGGCTKAGVGFYK